MIRAFAGLVLIASLGACSTMVPAPAENRNANSLISDRVKQLTRAAQWRPVASIPVNFNTQHPQGMVKIGDNIFATYNPFWIEPTAAGLRAYFMPEDEKSTLYVYEVDIK